MKSSFLVNDLDLIPAAVILFDSQGKIKTCNSNFEILSGYARDEIKKLKIQNLFKDSSEDLLQYCKNLKGITKTKLDLRNKHNEKISILVNIEQDDGSDFILLVSQELSSKDLHGAKCNECYFESIFYHSSMPMWIIDYSNAAQLINEQKIENGKDISNYIVENTDFIEKCLNRIKIIDVNQATLDLLGISNKEQFLLNPGEYISKSSTKDFANELLAIAASKSSCSYNSIINTKTDRDIHVEIKWDVLEGITRDYSRVFVTTIEITDWKKSEIALVESEKKYRTIVEGSHNGICIINENFRFVYVNQRFCEITGYVEKDLINQDFRKVLDDESIALVTDRYLKRQRGESVPSVYEFNILRQDKTIRNVVISSAVLHDHHGKVQTIAQLSDITEKRRAEQEAAESLRQSEKQFRQLIEHSNDAIYLLFNNRFEIINKKFTEIFGYTLEETRAENFNFIQLIAPESLPIVMQRVQDLKEGKKLKPVYEFTAIAKTGTRIDCETSVSYIDYKGQKATQGIIRDISRRKEYEAQIRKFYQAVDQSPASVMITSKNGQIEFVNRKFEEVTGYTFQEVEGKLPGFLKSGDMNSEEYRVLWDKILSGQTWQGEFHNKKKNGEPFWENAIISPIFDPDGSITHFLALKEDITDKKKLEQQFLQSQKMDAVGRLAGGIAHDFNNLLTVINGYSDLILQNFQADEKINRYLQQIKEAGTRAATLTSQLLAFSRKQILQPKIIDINQRLRKMGMMLRRIIGEDIELKTNLQKTLYPVKADPGQLEQVIMNLVVNAREAMPEGGTIKIKTRNEILEQDRLENEAIMKAGKYVRLTISDTGPGIETDLINKIFEPFFTTKGKGKGTGLGLSTVYGIVKQSGGNILASSDKGKGAVFRIYLPAVENELPNDLEETELAELDHYGEETILVVEDEATVKEFTVNLLSHFGYNILHASDGKSALKLVKNYKGKIHLLLTDVIMPKMDGRELAENVRKLFPDIKILFMSGYTDNTIIDKDILNDQTQFIQKPFTAFAISEKIKRVLS